MANNFIVIPNRESVISYEFLSKLDLKVTFTEQLTSKIKQAAALMDIKIIDHLIINPSEEYFSFADEGML